MEVQNSAAQPVMVRRIGQATVSRGAENAAEKSKVWKRAGVVAAAGVFFGFIASMWFETSSASAKNALSGMHATNNSITRKALPLVIPAESAAVKQTTNDAELEKLKARNRRLEALVQVLQKQRAQAGKRSAWLKK